MGSSFFVIEQLIDIHYLMQSSAKVTSKPFSEALAFVLPHHRSPRANTIVAGSLNAQGPAYSKRNVVAKAPSGSMVVLKL
jgi:hypothetical protein